jgi:hypothetical protein
MPHGDGYGSVLVSANGSVSLAGANIDTSALKQSTSISRNGYWPVYVPLYSAPYTYTNGVAVLTTKQFYGAVIGWLRFTNDSTALDGELVCVKDPVANDALYPQGFNHDVTILGSRYTPPATGTPAITINNGTVSLQNGDLLAPITTAASVAANNVVQVPAPNLRQLKLQLVPSTGLLKGSFVSPTSSTTIKLGGVVLQNQNSAAGCFRGATTSGGVNLQ